MATDWHPEDIKAAVRKSGTSLAALARDAGMSPNAFTHVLRFPRATAERVIAHALGVHPKVIWPSRYLRDGNRKNPQPVVNYQFASPQRNSLMSLHQTGAAQ